MSVCAPMCALCDCVCLGVPSCLHPCVPSSVSPTLGQPELPWPECPPSPPVLLSGPERQHWESIAAPKHPELLQLLLRPADFLGKWIAAPSGSSYRCWWCPCGERPLCPSAALSAPGLCMAQLPLPPVPPCGLSHRAWESPWESLGFPRAGKAWLGGQSCWAWATDLLCPWLGHARRQRDACLGIAMPMECLRASFEPHTPPVPVSLAPTSLLSGCR